MGDLALARRGAAVPAAVVWAIVGVALLVRLLVIGATIGFHTPAALEPASDSRIHMRLVESLLGGHGYSLDGQPTAITPPLYIFALAGAYRLWHDPAAVRAGQAALGAAGCLVLYAIGLRLFDRATGLVAAAILAVYPAAVYLAGLHLTENLFLFLLLLAILASVRLAERPDAIRAALFGLLIGLAALTRAAFLACVPLLLPWALAVWGCRGRVAYRVCAASVLAAIVVILPWTIRNDLALGAIVPVQSNGGLVFWAGNNPHSDGGLVWPTRQTWTATRPPDGPQYGWRGMGIAQENRVYVRAALSWIEAHPRGYLRLLGRKLVRLYGITRSAAGGVLAVPRPVRLAHAAFLALAAAGLVISLPRWRALAFVLALVLLTNVIVLLFNGATRYEVPMLPSLVLLSATAVVTISRRAAGAIRRPNAVATVPARG
jgi:4-amino-4-deoxy-L-arabinose transferase-like glycosyltransferase